MPGSPGRRGAHPRPGRFRQDAGVDAPGGGSRAGRHQTRPDTVRGLQQGGERGDVRAYTRRRRTAGRPYPHVAQPGIRDLQAGAGQPLRGLRRCYRTDTARRVDRVVQKGAEGGFRAARRRIALSIPRTSRRRLRGSGFTIQENVDAHRRGRHPQQRRRPRRRDRRLRWCPGPQNPRGSGSPDERENPDDLRRAVVPGRGNPPKASRRAFGLPAPLRFGPRGRGPGPHPRAVPDAQAALPAPEQPVRSGRRRPDDQHIHRGGPREHPLVSAVVSGRGDPYPGRELPVQARHRNPFRQRHFPQRQPLRQAHPSHTGRDRTGHRHHPRPCMPFVGSGNRCRGTHDSPVEKSGLRIRGHGRPGPGPVDRGAPAVRAQGGGPALRPDRRRCTVPIPRGKDPGRVSRRHCP